MKLKIKKLHPDAIVPAYASAGAGCFDLHSCAPGTQPLVLGGDPFLDPFQIEGHVVASTFDTGLAFEVPAGWVMLIFSRSGHGFKSDVRLANCVGVIDSDYRGEVAVRLSADTRNELTVCHGDRIAQAMLVPIPRVEFDLVDELGETARGAGGFGSTGQAAVPQDWSAADEAFDNHYHKVRAEMSRDEWRALWLKDETPHQAWLAKKAREDAEPIPYKVYFSREHANFYSFAGYGMGLEFYARWLSRSAEFPQQQPAREMSDREWAARDPSLREGSTVRVPGFGEL